MKKAIPFIIFIASFILLLKASIHLTTGEETINLESLSKESLGICSAVSFTLVILYKILIVKVKIAVAIAVLISIAFFFNLFA